jgi:SAM-dependent methyltransferase
VLKVAPDTPRLVGLLKALGDPIRLRILGLAATSELSVGELGESLGLAQSRVSNHLRVLRDQALLQERHAGTSTLLRFDPAAEGGLHERLWSALRPELERLPEHADDLARLRGVLEARRAGSRSFFDRVAGQWNAFGVDFATGQARQRVVANFVPSDLVVADLGCGTGYVARAFLGLASRVICVDSSTGMLDEARRGLGEAPTSTEVEIRPGELDALPIGDDEVDGAVCAMVLHHLERPDACLAEMFRIVRPGGVVVLLELAPHREAWMHEALGDRHLGLDSREVARSVEAAGFVDVRLEALADRYRPRLGGDADERPPADLPLYLIRGRVPAAPGP